MCIIQLLLSLVLLVAVLGADTKDPPPYPVTATWKGDVPLNEFGSRMAAYVCPSENLDDCQPKSFIAIGTKGINEAGTSTNPGTRQQPGVGEVALYEQDAQGDWSVEPVIRLTQTPPNHFNAPSPTQTGNDSYFGAAVAVHPSWIMVGAYKDFSRGLQGSAYIYNRGTDGKFSNNGFIKFNAPNATAERYGVAVGINSNAACVGASTALAQNGAVYVYQYPDSAPGNENRWSKTPYAILTGANAKVNFGHAISMTENYIAVGAPSSPAGVKGQVFIFGRSATAQCGNGKCFTNRQLLVLTGNVDRGQYGFSLFLTDQEILVGDWAAEFTANNAAGQAVVQTQVGQVHMVTFSPAGTSGLLGKTSDLLIQGGGASTQFGWSVAIAQQTFVVGGNDNKVWVYGKENGVWTSTVKAVQVGEGGGYGFAVATSDKWVCVGAPLNLGATAAQKFTGGATMYRVYEDSPLSVTILAAISCAGLTVLCACLLWARYMCSPKGDPPLMDARAAAKAARLGFKHHNVAHKQFRRKGDVESGQKTFLAPQDHNPLRASGMYRQQKGPTKAPAAPVPRPAGVKTFQAPSRSPGQAKTAVVRNTPMNDL